jgi:23S rRNA pseudouridine1911/1915/1917 synthase
VIREQVPAALDGERLDRIVALLADVSRSAAAATITAGGVTVDGTPSTSGKVRLAEGAVVEVDPAAIPRAELPTGDPAVEVDVVHVDDAVIVVDKPAGLVVHPGAGNAGGTLVNGLLARFPEVAGVGDPMRPGIVHRLDAGSSGLLVVGRTGEAAASLIAQLAAHHDDRLARSGTRSARTDDRLARSGTRSARTAGRRYDAVVWGQPDAAHGIVDAPIGRDPADPLKMAVVVGGKPARTEYHVVARFDEPARLARVSCTLQTGRTHQIRVHLAAIGHPLVGDPVYGERRTTLGLSRPFLHAAELSFDHPTTGQRLTFTSPLPDDLATWLASLHPSV